MEEHKLANLMPVTVVDKQKMADYLAKSGLMPKGLDTGTKVFVALQMGHELGLSPMMSINNISVINGKPVLSADIQVAVVRKHPEFAGMKIEDNGEKCTVTIKRKAPYGEEEFQASFSAKDALAAGLMGKDNWKHYPQRMRKHRATAYAIRDAFPDGLAGFYTREEMEDEIIEAPKKSSMFDSIVAALNKIKDQKKRSDTAKKELENNNTLTDDEINYIQKTFCDTTEQTSIVLDGQIVNDEEKVEHKPESQATDPEELKTNVMLDEIEAGMAKEEV